MNPTELTLDAVRVSASMDTSVIKGILFDLDGTLIDTYETILQSMQHAVRTVIHADIPAERLMKKVGQPLVKQVADFCDSPEECAEVLTAYRAYNAEIHDRTTKGFPGCAEALDSLLGAGFVLGVVTSKMHKPALEGLRLFGLDGKISCLVGADDCRNHKPDPEPVLRGVELLGYEPFECVYVGDSPFDIQAGNAAGVTTIAALWGMFSSGELKAQKPDFCCATISDCADLILRNYSSRTFNRSLVSSAGSDCVPGQNTQVVN